VIRAILLVTLLSLSGCFTSWLSDDSIACDSQASCPDGYVCSLIEQRCVTGAVTSGCSLHQDCPFGQICESSACVAGCRETGDCGLDRDCVEGQCAAAGTCTTDAVCPLGESCDVASKRCVKPAVTANLCDGCFEPRYCRTSADCGGGVTCDRPDPEAFGVCQDCGAGDCRYDATDQACSDDAQCGDGEYCHRVECNDNDYCQERGFGACNSPLHRIGSAKAEGLSNCAIGACRRAYCVYRGCALEDDPTSTAPHCPRGYYCYRIIAPPKTPNCTQDAQCPSGSCVRVNEADSTMFCSCRTNTDCPDGSTCDAGSCLTGTACEPELGLTCEDIKR